MRAVFDKRHNYEDENVTTGAWFELFDETPDSAQALHVFDGSGEVMELGTGAPGEEESLMLIPPGGQGFLDLTLFFRTRLVIRAVSANAVKGELVLNFFKQQ